MNVKIWLLILLMALTPLASNAHAEGTLPRLKVEANRIVKGAEPVTLRGVSLCSLEWHKPLDQIETVTQSPDKWNVNVLRLPVQVKEWDRVGEAAYIRDRLDPAVKICTKNKVYCIIDWHQIGAWNDPTIVNKMKTFWKAVAPRYAANTNILYEVFNEPTEPTTSTRENWLAWRRAAQPWVDDIRRAAPNTLILVGSPHWSQMPSFAVQDPFRGANLAYVMHLYPNWSHDQWDKLMGDASKTVPIFVTEWGWSAQKKAWWGISGTEENYGAPLRKYMDERPAINWTAWSYDPLCGPAMLGGDKDMGAFVKKWLSDVN